MGIFSKLFGQTPPQNPEDKFVVTITDEFVRVEHPSRKAEEIFWKDINEIRFLNTDAGPFAPDLWLALIGEKSGCLIPHGSEGCDKVYEIVSKYPGFNYENVIKAMSSSNNEQFLLWQKNK